MNSTLIISNSIFQNNDSPTGTVIYATRVVLDIYLSQLIVNQNTITSGAIVDIFRGYQGSFSIENSIFSTNSGGKDLIALRLRGMLTTIDATQISNFVIK